eukprot:scaffold38356_cov237-Amphora_coffeaeformis.AAC.1
MSQGDDRDEPAPGASTDVAPPLPSTLVDETESVLSGDNNQGSSHGSTVYKYRDFSTVNEDDEDAVETPEGGPVPAPSRNTMETSIRVQKFPVKLYAILAQKEFNDIIAWMPHGRSWKVLKPNVFESLVMPLFFEYSNYHSFNRLVNAWSFRRVSSGPDRGSYYHELFLRGKPHLQKYMRRLPKTHKKLPMRKQDEPDFYLLDKTNPLPAIEDAPIPGGLSVSNALRGGGSGGVPVGMSSMGGAGMGGIPPQGPVGMPGRGMMPPPAVSHAPQPRFPQGVYNSDPLQGPDEGYGDMPQQGDRGMMGRGLMQSNNGAFRSPMAGQGMPHGRPGQGLNSGMAAQMPSASRMAQQMGGRGAGMSNQMYPSAAGMSNQFMNMNPMQAAGGSRMGATGMRRFRPLPPGIDGSAMPNDQGMMSSGYSQDNASQDEFFQQRQQQQMRSRMSQMDQMPTMSH